MLHVLWGATYSTGGGFSAGGGGDYSTGGGFSAGGGGDYSTAGGGSSGAELLRVPYLNDSSMHAQMVRFATARFEAGHLPLTSWFPYLGLGSPQFLHYQSLPALLTGLLGVAIGPNQAFRWSLA
jgi:hypothetical protein